MELWDWRLLPGDRHVSRPHQPGTRELVQVQGGILTIEVGDSVVVLDEGDAVAFSGDVPHSYANAGDEPTRFSLAVLEPGAGRRSRAEAADV
ncbi:MAG TPA: cupin domain-containing protein [Naasia sp.]|jgi:quercetin dioxygenase-like cupin family protein